MTPSSLRRLLPVCLWGVLVAAGPARAQMTEEQFMNAVMPVLGKADFSHGRAVMGLWMAPEFWAYHVASEKEPNPGDALGQQKLVEQLLIFMLVPIDDKPLPGLRTAAARAVLRLPDGAAISAMRVPSGFEQAVGADGKKGDEPVMVVFPARRRDGSPTLAAETPWMRLELPEAGRWKARTFEWALPIAFPAEVTQELERLTTEREARVRAFTPPAADVAEAMFPWLSEFGTAGGALLAAVWCPPEWWELNLAADKDVDAAAKAGVRLLLNDLTTFVLMTFDRKDARSLSQWAERCVLIDASGARHTPVKLPAELQAEFKKGMLKGMAKGDDLAGHLLAFKVKLDAAAEAPFQLVLQDGKGQPVTVFRWAPPLALPPSLAAALAAARRP